MYCIAVPVLHLFFLSCSVGFDDSKGVSFAKIIDSTPSPASDLDQDIVQSQHNQENCSQEVVNVRMSRRLLRLL